MREILFRGKRIDGKGWIEGFYFQKFSPCSEDGQPIYHGISDLPPFGYEVIPETVGQYIGQDKNGTKIFEGDIVKIGVTYGEGYNPRSVTGVVAYDDIGCLGVIVEYYDGHPVWSDIICELELSGAIEDYCFEVIGNIHDNPEMIGGKEE